MMRSLLPILAAPLLAAGCSTDAVTNDDVLLLKTPGSEGTSGQGGLFMQALLDASPEHPLRLKVNGKLLVQEDAEPGHYVFAEIQAFGFGIGTVLPEGAYEVDVLRPDGQVLAHTAPIAVRPPLPDSPGVTLYSYVIVYPTPDGNAALLVDPRGDDDPETKELLIRNASSDAVVAYSCITTATGADCTALATIAPGETSSSKQPVTHVGPRDIGERYIALQLATGGLSPNEAISLNEPSSRPCDTPSLLIYGNQTVTDGSGQALGREPLYASTCRF